MSQSYFKTSACILSYGLDNNVFCELSRCSVCRIQTYHLSTMPIIDHYNQQNLVRHIDASRSVEEVRFLTSYVPVYHLYYCSSPVPEICPQNFDENVAARSQFDSDHHVNFYAPTTFVPPLFAFVLFFTTKIIINFATFCNVVFALIARWCHRRLLLTKNYAQLRTMVDFIVLSIKLVFMVLGVSYSRVLNN